MAKEMDLMKVGLYALAGFGAFAVYNKYIAKKSDTPATEGTDPTSSFTGTRWQQDTAGGTSWQRGNVFSNAAGGPGPPNCPQGWGIYRTGGPSSGGVTGQELYADIMRNKSACEMRNGMTASTSGRMLNMAGSGTNWQNTGYSGTSWQENLNAAGYVSNPNDNETWGIYRTGPGGTTGKQLHSQIMDTKNRVVGRSNPNDNETWGIYRTGPGGATGKDLNASIMATKARATGMPISDSYRSMAGTDWQRAGYSGTNWQEYSNAAGCGGCGA